MCGIENYFVCNRCGQIEPTSRWGSNGEQLRCPHCFHTGFRNLWPPVEVKTFIDFIKNYDCEAPFYSQIATVFLSSFLELMFEELLSVMAYMDLLYDEVDMLVDALLDGYQGRSRMFVLYKRLGYGSFHKEVEELGYKKFLEHWDIIVSARNKVVHGKPKEGEKINSSIVKITIKEALSVFSSLHNRYNMESLHYSTATKNISK